jgi:hypothetical protein
LSRWKSTRLVEVVIRTSMPGWASWKADSRGSSHFAASEASVETVSTWSSSRRSRRSVASRRSLKAARTPGRYSDASAVSVSARFWRMNSRTPSSCSSRLIWWLIAVCVTFSSEAAWVKLKCRAAASNARNPFSEGSLADMIRKSSPDT